MSPRIKELAFAATNSSNWKPGLGNPQVQEYMEKFAELIVRECAEVAACNGHVSGFALSDLIKQHFGVEQ